MPSVSRGMANSMKGVRQCEGCGMKVPTYPGRYPKSCPDCGGGIKVIHESLLSSMNEGKSASEVVDNYIHEQERFIAKVRTKA